MLQSEQQDGLDTGRINVLNLSAGISIETLTNDVLLVRKHVNCGVYGDPFEFVATILLYGDRAEIKGLCVAVGGRFTRRDHMALDEYLRAICIKRCVYERIKGREINTFELK